MLNVVLFSGGRGSDALTRQLHLQAGRDVNRALDDYCALLGLPAGLIDNVTDGRHAHLVALDATGGLPLTEAAIVDARAPSEIQAAAGPAAGRG